MGLWFPFLLENQFPCLKGWLPCWALLWLMKKMVWSSSSSIICYSFPSSMSAKQEIQFMNNLAVPLSCSSLIASLMASVCVLGSLPISATLIAWLTPITKKYLAKRLLIFRRGASLIWSCAATGSAAWLSSRRLASGHQAILVTSLISMVHLLANSLIVPPEWILGFGEWRVLVREWFVLLRKDIGSYSMIRYVVS